MELPRCFDRFLEETKIFTTNKIDNKFYSKTRTERKPISNPSLTSNVISDRYKKEKPVCLTDKTEKGNENEDATNAGWRNKQT